MDDMVRDMRNRFFVALVLAAGIPLWSPMGRETLGFTAHAPLDLRDDVFALILSLPVEFYSAWIYFDGAWAALRNPHIGHDGPRRGGSRCRVALSGGMTHLR